MSSSHDHVPSQELLHRIRKMRERKPRCIIAIDGRGGAGKSSLAREIVRIFPGAQHFEFDWFHLPLVEVTPRCRFDSQRLVREVLQPFCDGVSAFEFKRYNWGYLAGASDGFAEEPVRLRDVDVIVLEGCGVLDVGLVGLFDLSVWVDTPAHESLTRGMRRDIEEYGLDPEKVRNAWHEWAAWEAEALSQDDRRLRADIVV